MRKRITSLLCLFILLWCCSITAYADTEIIDSYGWVDLDCFAPYFNGIDYIPVFDVDYYYEVNPDLQQVIGKNDELLFKHFLAQGMAEGRKSSPYFDVNIYINNNSDLVELYGNDLAQYYLHYATVGWQEQRKACNDDPNLLPNCFIYYNRIKKAIEQSCLEPENAETIATNNHGYVCQIGWGPTDIGYHYDTWEHDRQLWLYAQRAAAVVCAEYPNTNWWTAANVSNLCWEKNPWFGPKEGNDQKYIGENFLSEGYLWIKGISEIPR